MALPTSRPRVRSERKARVALLTLDNPPVNVLSAEVLIELSRCLHEAEANPEVRVVVLASAAERAFAAGANIREMAGLRPAQAKVHGGRGQALTRQIERSPLPVIAAVNGVCLGGGCEVALACDFIVASEDASFGQPEIALGIMPGWGGTQRLAHRIGAARARRWILTGRSVTAREAADQGLVDRVVPRPELLPAALSLAEELAERAPLALAAAKYALNHSIDTEVDRALSYELGLWSRLFGTAGQRDGMQAFLEKRPYSASDRQGWARISEGFPWARREPAKARRARRRGGKRKN